MAELEYYKGILIRTATKVHEVVFSKVSKYLKKNAHILDLGAGEGALSLRLQDAGYKNIDAVEIEPDRFVIPGIKNIPVDLNTDFSHSFKLESYDGILAIELAEHLENTIHFLRECSKILKSDGYLILSTPNISSIRSRFQFLWNGSFRHFSVDDFKQSGHIQPLTEWQIERAAEMSGMRVIERSSNPDSSLYEPQGIKDAALVLVMRLVRPFLRGPLEGDVQVLVMRKI